MSEIRAVGANAAVQALCCESSCSAWLVHSNCPSGSQPLGSLLETTPASQNPTENCCTRACEPGSYRDANGRCNQCPAGTFVNNQMARCDVCAVGSFAPAGSTKCEACAPGSYDDDFMAATPCVLCDEGKFTLSPYVCDGICPDGTYGAPGTTSSAGCQSCRLGWFDHDAEKIAGEQVHHIYI